MKKNYKKKERKYNNKKEKKNKYTLLDLYNLGYIKGIERAIKIINRLN